jgi:hypothetical protein
LLPLLFESAEKDDLLARARTAARALVEADGLTDDDIDAMIDEARAEVARGQRS